MDGNLSRLYYILGNCDSPKKCDEFGPQPPPNDSSLIGINTNSAEIDRLLFLNGNSNNQNRTIEFPRSKNDFGTISGMTTTAASGSTTAKDGELSSLICTDDFETISSLPLNVNVGDGERIAARNNTAAATAAADAATLDVTSNITVVNNGGYGGGAATSGINNYKVMFSKNGNCSQNQKKKKQHIICDSLGADIGCHRRLTSTSTTTTKSMLMPTSTSNSTTTEMAETDPETVLVDIHFNPLYTVDSSGATVALKSCQIPLSSSGGGGAASAGGDYSDIHFRQQQQQLHLLSPPTDRYGLIYLALLLAGIGFLLPYNSFVIASDYFQQRFPTTTIVFDMSTIYIVVAFLTVIVNNVMVDCIPLFWRLNMGYLLSLAIMIFVMLYEVCAEMGGYRQNLVAIGIAAIGCTIQQSSFYGYTSMLPKRYTQAVMTGESAAGIFVSLNRIFTKILFPNDPQYNTVLFFVISIVVISICALVHIVILPRSSFIRYHIMLCQQQKRNEERNNDGASRIMHQINENLGLVNMYNHHNHNQHGNNNNSNTLLIDTSSINTDQSTVLPIDHHLYILGSARPSIYSALDGSLDQPLPDRSLNHKVQNILRTDSTEFVLPFGIDDEEIAAVEQQRNHTKFDNLLIPTESSPNIQQQQQISPTSRQREHHYSGGGDSSDGGGNESSFNSGQFYTKSATSKMVQFLTWFENVTHSLRKVGLFFRQLRQCDRWLSYLIGSLRKKYYIRRMIISRVWTQIVSIILVYFVTLTIFPGIESEIYSCEFRSWMPIILMATFNLTDFIGKLMSTFFYRITGAQMVVISMLRFLLIPLLAFCVAPRIEPFFANPFWPILFSIVLGITNGIFGSLPMILAPIRVGENMREITGNLMTFSYVIGLTAGSFASYGLNYLVVGGAGGGGGISDNNITYDYFLEQCSSDVVMMVVAPSSGVEILTTETSTFGINNNTGDIIQNVTMAILATPSGGDSSLLLLPTMIVNNVTTIAGNIVANNSNNSAISTFWRSFF